jgi:hypothetical protein
MGRVNRFALWSIRMFGPNIFPLARLVAAALLASTALAAAQSADGQGWDATTRNNFYTQDQGTRL